MATPSSATSAQKQELYEHIVDAFNAIFGTHPGYRAAHAKGIVCEGTFTPAAAAASLSRAPHFQRDSVPVTVRFSDATGIPTIPDGDPNASPRGLGIKFHLPGGVDSDIVAHSYNGFPVGTAEEFLGFLQALATSGPTAPKPTPIEAFLGTRPRALGLCDDAETRAGEFRDRIVLWSTRISVHQPGRCEPICSLSNPPFAG